MMTFDWFATWRNAGLSWPAPERPAPCMAEPNGRERKTIGRLNPCPDCKRHECWLYYLRWEVERGIDLNADQHHLVKPAPDAKRCKLCNQLVGVWNRTHFARTTDDTPCKGSWK